MMHIPVHFVKFWSDTEPIISHENPLANYRCVEVYVKSASNHVVLRYHNSDGGLKLKPVRFSEFPSFAMCSSAIRRKFNVSDEWEFQLTCDGTAIAHNTNLAFLESSGEKPIDIVPGRLVAYDICERQDLIWTHPSWTVKDLIAKVSSGPKSKLRNPDKLDEVLLKSRNLSEFYGKTLSILHGTDHNFHLVFAGWKKAPDIAMPDRIADTKLALFSRFRREFPVISPDQVYLCSHEARG
jgi:hypothetical protein